MQSQNVEECARLVVYAKAPAGGAPPPALPASSTAQKAMRRQPSPAETQYQICMRRLCRATRNSSPPEVSARAFAFALPNAAVRHARFAAALSCGEVPRCPLNIPLVVVRGRRRVNRYEGGISRGCTGIERWQAGAAGRAPLFAPAGAEGRRSYAPYARIAPYGQARFRVSPLPPEFRIMRRYFEDRQSVQEEM